MRKILSAMLSLGIVLSMSACSVKDMAGADLDPSTILEEISEESQLLLEVGDTKEIPITLPIPDATVKIKSFSEDIVSASLENSSNLKIKGLAVGEGKIEFEFSAKGFKAITVEMPVKVEPKALDLGLQLTDENGENIFFDGSVLKMPTGENALFDLNSEKGLEYNVDTKNSENVEAKVSENKLEIKAKADGEAKVKLSAKCEDKNNSVCEKEITVVGVPKVKVVPSLYNVSLKNGETAAVNISTNVASKLTADVASGNASVVLDGNAIKITGGTQNSVVNVKADCNDCAPSTVQITVAAKEAEKTSVVNATKPNTATTKSNTENCVTTNQNNCTPTKQNGSATQNQNNCTPTKQNGSATQNQNNCTPTKQNGCTTQNQNNCTPTKQNGCTTQNQNNCPRPNTGGTTTRPNVENPTKPETDKQTPNVSVDTSEYDDEIAEIIRYTNEAREEAGLPKLSHVTAVDAPATLRAKEASIKWSHTRPDQTMYHTIFKELGLSYPTNGENLFTANMSLSPKKVVEEWMNSKGHRENILRPEFTGIGVGCYEEGGNVYWCQLFVG